MWKSLFEAITAAFGFVGALLRKAPADEPVDAAAARAGTAAGAAANTASHTAKTVPPPAHKS